ncbi:tetratricopeptide repeat protein [Candidatus Palauibacter sp.]|uniref:tetratricopeptide repeat protein n=1 Tax=Candidatus Palauibacter sp. TaxID=3101350 RepID=UPI003AF2EA70
MVGLLNQLMERRVPHVLAIYAGASWGLIEFTEFLVGVFLLSQRLTILVMAALCLLLPSVAMLAWFHGRRGRDDVPTAEKIGIPVNLAVAAAVLLVLFRGQDLGATTTTVYVETDEGEFVERRVPKPEYRKRAALFPFEAGSRLREHDAWLPYIVPIALELDLGDAEFFEPLPPDLFAPQLAQLGFEDLQGVPLPLKRELSEELQAGLIASGTLDRADADDEYRVTFTLHSVSTGSQVSQTVYEGRDFLTLIDQMSVELAEALEIPDYTDLPVRERMTADDAALEAFGQGIVQLLVPPWDLDVALDEFGAATMFDPTFALAQYQLALMLNNAGRPAEAVASLRTAIAHRYRLPERTDFLVNFEYFWLTGQMDEAWAVSERWVTVRPDDQAALAYLSAVQTVRDDWEGLLATLRTLHGLSPDDHSLLLQMADAYLRLGDDEQALGAVERYVEQAPDDYSGYVELARIRRRRGEHESAREPLTQALLIHPTMPELVIERASLDLEVGRFDEALRGYEEALDLANTPEQRIGVLTGLKGYFRLRGQLGEAIETTTDWLDEASMVLTPAEIAQDRFPDIDLYLDAGRVQDADLLLDRLQSEQPPMGDFLVPHYRIHIEIGAEDSGAARAAYRAAIEAMEAYGVDAFRPRLIADLGRIEELVGDYDLAIQHYREAMNMEPGRNVHRETGRALRKAGRLEEAESALREALRRRPADPQANLEMALVLEARGETERAREHLRSALTAWEPADDSFEPARTARAKRSELDGAN